MDGVIEWFKNFILNNGFLGFSVILVITLAFLAFLKFFNRWVHKKFDEYTADRLVYILVGGTILAVIFFHRLVLNLLTGNFDFNNPQELQKLMTFVGYIVVSVGAIGSTLAHYYKLARWIYLLSLLFLVINPFLPYSDISATFFGLITLLLFLRPIELQSEQYDIEEEISKLESEIKRLLAKKRLTEQDRLRLIELQTKLVKLKESIAYEKGYDEGFLTGYSVGDRKI